MSEQNLPEDDLGLYVNFPVSNAIARAASDPEAAARVLLLAEDILRARKPIPYALADYLADAFGAAMRKPEEKRVEALALELNLRAKNKRPSKFDWFDAYLIMQANLELPRPQLVALLRRKGDCSESHARRLLDVVEEAIKKSDRILREEDESELDAG
jgi:hypothetical protein